MIISGSRNDEVHMIPVGSPIWGQAVPHSNARTTGLKGGDTYKYVKGSSEVVSRKLSDACVS